MKIKGEGKKSEKTFQCMFIVLTQNIKQETLFSRCFEQQYQKKVLQFVLLN
jgi:hypothetical protein